MLHLLPESQEQPQPYAEAVSRLASVRNALRLVAPFGAGPASDFASDGEVAAAWDEADNALQRLFDRRSRELLGTATAGVEALAEEYQAGRTPHHEATAAMVDQIRRELADVAGIVLA